jgi:hypothetical protein
MSCVKSFLLHYIPNEIALHKLVYPNWEVSISHAYVSIRPRIRQHTHKLVYPNWEVCVASAHVCSRTLTHDVC